MVQSKHVCGCLQLGNLDCYTMSVAVQVYKLQTALYTLAVLESGKAGLDLGQLLCMLSSWWRATKCVAVCSLETLTAANNV